MAERLKSVVPLAMDYTGQNVTDWFWSEKLDGMRAVWRPRERMLTSRYGKKIHAPEWWLDQLPTHMALDGELYAGPGEFQTVMSVCRASVSYRDWEVIQFCPFDIPYTDMPFVQKVEALMTLDFNSVVRQVHQVPVVRGFDVTEELLKITSKGGEGIVFKYPFAVWTPKRTKHILRIKNVEMDVGVIVNANIGKGKHEGRMGSLTVAWAGKVFDIGTGFTDQEREQEWVPGTEIRFAYRELTLGGVPKEGRYVRP